MSVSALRTCMKTGVHRVAGIPLRGSCSDLPASPAAVPAAENTGTARPRWPRHARARRPRHVLIKTATFVALALAGSFALRAEEQPKPDPSKPHKTDWLHKAKWGVMCHVQGDRAPGKWDKVIDGFDVKGLARQLQEVGAGYFMITSIHADYPIAPNAAYEKRYPGQCPKRDLIMDLADELAKYDIPLLLYYNSNIKWEPTQEGVIFRAAVLEEFSRRYGAKVKGWWFDNTLPKLERPRVLEFHKLIADAARAGNGEALLAFSPPHGPQRNSPFDDFTAGNLHNLDKVTCPGRFADGAQWHTLCYLGTTWGSRRPRYQGNEAAAITKRLTDAGGVVTWDTPHELDGLLAKSVIPQLKAIGEATETIRK